MLGRRNIRISSDRETVNLRAYSSQKAIKAYNKIGLTPVEKKVVGRYFKKPKASILDLGCGLGRTTVPLVENGFEVVAIDNAEPMIKMAKAKFPGIDFRAGDACNLRFADEFFDYVLFSFNGIDCIYPEDKRIKALREIKRVLKKGGIFVFSSHNPWQLLPLTFSHYCYLVKYFSWNIFSPFIFSRYKKEVSHYGNGLNYFISPPAQIKQLKSLGFKTLSVIGEHKSKLKYFELWPYYAAQKEQD